MSDSILSANSNPAAERVSTKVVTAVAGAKDVDPIDLPPLYDAIDPDALNQLFRPGVQSVGSAAGQVRFTFAGCDVVVDSDNQVTVTPTDSNAERGLEA